MGRSSRIVEIERHPLADGGTIRVTRLGRKYNFHRWSGDGQDCESEMGISKKEAMHLFEQALKADVFETED